MSVNKVILIGRLGADPEVKSFDSGIKVANLRMVTSESWKDKNGEKVEQTEWHTVNLWKGLADIAEKYLKKGDQIYIEGRIKTREWQDKDSNKRYCTEIEASKMTMLGSKNGNQTNQTQTQTQANNEQPVKQQEEEDLPF